MAWSRTSRQARGYGRQWELLRLQALARDQYLCVQCRAAGRFKAAQCVDHVVPKARNGPSTLANTQSLCLACHRIKTDAENGRVRKARIGADGYPVSTDDDA